MNDDWGSSWKHNVDVTADVDGTISDSFTLPAWFVATYSVVATGELSGVATTSFTDGSVRVQTVGAGANEASVAWVLYSAANCTGSVVQSGSISAQTGDPGTRCRSGTTSPQSMLLTAQPISGHVFSSWENGNFVDDAVNPACLNHTNGTQNTDVVYAAAADTTAPTVTIDSITGTDDGSPSVL